MNVGWVRGSSAAGRLSLVRREFFCRRRINLPHKWWPERKKGRKEEGEDEEEEEEEEEEEGFLPFLIKSQKKTFLSRLSINHCFKGKREKNGKEREEVLNSYVKIILLFFFF